MNSIFNRFRNMFNDVIKPKAISIYTKSSNYLTSKAYKNTKHKNTSNIKHTYI